jgi:hypothetical protein
MLRLLRFDPATGKGKRLEILSELEQDSGTLGPWSFVSDGPGEGLGIAVSQHGRQSTWIVFRVNNHHFEVVKERPAELPKVSCLDWQGRETGPTFFSLAHRLEAR